MDHPQINLESYHHEKRADGAVLVRIQTSNLYKEGKDIKKLLFKSFSNEGMDFNVKVSERVAQFKKGGFSETTKCFPLIITLDSDDEDCEDVCPPLYYFFR